MSYVTSYFHVVFSTRNRQPTINNANREHLYRVIGAEIKKMHSMPLIINGVPDHIHILFNLRPTVALSDLMREVKSRSSLWMKNSGMFPLFDGWEREYGAFSVSAGHVDAVKGYILGQQEHHRVKSMLDEYQRLVLKAGLKFYAE